VDLIDDFLLRHRSSMNIPNSLSRTGLEFGMMKRVGVGTDHWSADVNYNKNMLISGIDEADCLGAINMGSE